jgi:hypothetical protein
MYLFIIFFQQFYSQSVFNRFYRIPFLEHSVLINNNTQRVKKITLDLAVPLVLLD